MTRVFGLFVKPEYSTFNGADKETGHFISSANLENYFNGISAGLNTISGDLVGGVVNKHVSPKESKFYAENGFYPDPTWAAIA